MKGYKILLFQFFYLTLIISSFAQSSNELKIDQPYVKNQLIIKFKNDIDIVQKEGVKLIINDTVINNIHKNFGIVCERILFSSSKNNLNLSDEPLLYKFNNSLNIEILISKLLETNLYEYVEPNYLSKGHGICTYTPNDFYFNLGNQWGLVNTGSFNGNAIYDADIDMEFGWGITRGNQNTIVAVLDGGTKLDHIELNGRLWTNPTEVVGNGIDDDANGYIDDINGWDFVNSDNDPTDDNGHGTNVIGIIGATGNNGIGYAGVNWNCKLMTCKVLDSFNTGSNSGIIAAIYYSVDNGADVINMSLGSGFFSAAFEAAIDYAYNNNVVTVASMGNDNNNITQYPAGYTNCIAVGATDTDNKRVNPFPWSAASGSNYGNHIDVVAPGNYIYGLSHLSSTNYNTYYSGTSQAAPLVTGLVSLIRGLDSTISPDSIRSILHNTSIDQVGDISEDVPGWDQYYGYGLINTYNALKDLAIGRDTVHICSGTNYTFPDGSIQYNITSLIIDTSYIQSASFCDSTVITTLIVDSTVFANITDSVICFGDSIILTGSGAATSYTWDNGVVDGVSFYPTSTATYTVTGNISGSCNSDQITVVVNSLPTVSANSSSNNICIGNDLFLYGSGNSTSYTWDNGAIDSVIFSPTLTTLYTVLGTDSNNCANSDTITIFVSPDSVPNLSITATDTNICMGDSVTLSGNGASTYIWNNGITDSVPFSLDSSNIFIVSGTALNGCTDTISIFIKVDTVLVIANASLTQICLGDSVTLTGSGIASSYNWDNGVVDGIAFLPLDTAMYTVTGTNLGCTGKDSILIFVNPYPIPLTISSNSTSPYCTGDSIVLSVPSVPNVNYCWQNANTNYGWDSVGTEFVSNYNYYRYDLAFHPVTNEPYAALFGVNGIMVKKFNGINWEFVGDSATSIGITTVNYISLSFNPQTLEPYIAYSDFNYGSKTVVKKFNGVNWVIVGTPGFSGYSSTGNKIAFDPISSEPYVFMVKLNRPYVMKFNGYYWDYVGYPGFSYGPISSDLDLVFNPVTNEPYISYSDGSYSNKTLVRRFNGTDWVSVFGTSGTASYGSIAFHPVTNELYLAYRDSQNGNKLSVIKNIASVTTNVGTLGFSNGLVFYPRIAINPTTLEPVVAYTETSNSNLVVKRFQGMNWIDIDTNGLFAGSTVPNRFVFNPITKEPYIIYNKSNKIAVIKYSSLCLGSTNNYSVTQGGIYELIVSSAGCSTASSNQITINSTPIVIANTSDSVICQGETVKLNASGTASNFSWNNGAFNDSVFSPTSSTTYILNGSNNSCSAYDSVQITVNPIPVTSISPIGPIDICLGDSIALNAPSNGNAYCWYETSSVDWQNVGASDFSLGNIYNQCIEFNPSSLEPYIAYIDISQGNKVTVKKYDGTSWQTVGTPSFTASNIYRLDLEFNPITNEPYVITEGNNTTINVYKFDGNSWVSVGPPNFNSGFGVQIIFNPVTNQPYIISRINLSGNAITVRRFDGTNWQSVGNMSINSNSTGRQLMFFHPQTNDLYYFYYGYNSSTYGVWLKKLVGNNWVTPNNINLVGGFQDVEYNPQTNELYVVSSNPIGQLAVFKLVGTIWQPIGLSNFSEGTSNSAKIKFHPITNEPYVSFNNDYGTNVVKFNGSNWEYVGSKSFFTSSSANFPTDMDLDPITGTPYVSFGTSNDKISVKKFVPLCTGSSDTFFASSTGIYETIATNSYGCSDTSLNDVIVNVNILPQITISTIPYNTICYGDSMSITAASSDSLFWNNNFTNGGTISPDSSTSYIVTAIDNNNCFNSDTVDITVNPTYLNYQTKYICSNQSYILPGGDTILVSGIYKDTLNSYLGCDSIIESNISFMDTISINENSTICQGETYTLPSGNTVTSAGNYIDTLIAYGGCDSIIFTSLSVNPIYINNQNQSICQGDSVLIYGNYENTAGVYYDTLQSILGCDSVLATTLFLNANFNTSQNQEICQGDSIILGGSYQTIGGVYYDSLQTINGCDSVLSTILTVNSLPNVTLNNFNPDTICSNGSVVTLPNGSPSGGVYSGTGVSGGTFDPNTAGIGIHSVIYTYTDVNSCINSDSTFITVEQCVGMDDLANDLGILIYPNPNTGLFTIEKSSELDKEVRVSLLDASSRVIIDKLIPKGQQKIEMDITNYSKGVYYLQLTVGEEVFVKKILKN